MLTIIIAASAVTALTALINRLGSRKVAVVVKPVVFVETRDFSTPDCLVRRMQADRAAHVADFRQRIIES